MSAAPSADAGPALRVLLVEDNDGDALLVTEALVDLGGIQVERARTLGEALAMIADEPPACAVLDLGLPDAGDGLDALHRVLDAAPTLAVVVLTGLDDARTAGAAVAAGAQDYIAKAGVVDGDALGRAIGYAARRAKTVQALRASNDELSAFAHTVAHDLRSPLSAVVGLASLLASDHPLGEDQRRDLARKIVGTGERLSRLVNGLLSYSEHAGSEREVVDLAGVMEWATGLVQHDLDTAGGVIKVGEMAKVISNEPALRTIALNLLSNSIKHRSAARALVITVDSAVEADQVVLTVGDNGAGIEPVNRLRVFDLGARATDEATGVGIGLSSVRRMVQQLDGRVWIADGNDGVGVRVRVALPRDGGGSVDPAA